MPTKREIVYLAGGIAIGVYAPKHMPKLKVVKFVTYAKEIVAAHNRLQKIVVEEYERIDEAIAAEQAFVRMLDPQIKMNGKLFFSPVTFSVKDDGEQRSINTHIGE